MGVYDCQLDGGGGMFGSEGFSEWLIGSMGLGRLEIDCKWRIGSMWECVSEDCVIKGLVQ